MEIWNNLLNEELAELSLLMLDAKQRQAEYNGFVDFWNNFMFGGETRDLMKKK